MRPPNNRNARCSPGVGKETAIEKWKPTSDNPSPDAGQSRHAAVSSDPRSARRQLLVAHLHEAGPRSVLEALISVAAGNGLDEVLADFARLPVATYRAVGADVLPIPLRVIKGARR